ncbi:MAG: fibronectin type III domain-containing protein, partial [Capsulimonadaceae bacterium]
MSASTSFTDTGLGNATTFYYKVSGVNGAGTSIQSTEASAITLPAAPTGLSATGGSGQVSLSWGSVTGATSYCVYSGTSSSGEGATPVATGITSTAYTNSGLSAGTTYYYKVASVDAAGTSAESSEADAIT